MAEVSARPERPEPDSELLAYFKEVLGWLGPQGWWPARTRLEVILGAILTQNTSWNNAAMGIRGLRRAGLLSWPALGGASQPELEAAIRPAGFYRQKARTIRNFISWLERSYGGSLGRMFAQPAEALRQELLGVKGLGPETVDAILLYAGEKPFFVADAYTRRILARHEFISPQAGYATAQEFLHRHLPADAGLFNEFHALLVEVAKRFCKRSTADCAACPLEAWLPAREESRAAAALTALQAERV
jgi:endonuclease III related protein